jgi:hypothetical protein
VHISSLILALSIKISLCQINNFSLQKVLGVVLIKF